MKVTTLNRFRGLLEERRRGTSTVSLEITVEKWGPSLRVHTASRWGWQSGYQKAAETWGL